MDKVSTIDEKRIRKLERKARNTLILSIVSVVIPFLGLSLVGLICAIIALKMSKCLGKNVASISMYKRLSAAKVLSVIGIVLSIVVAVVSVVASVVLAVAVVVYGVSVLVSLVTAFFGLLATAITAILSAIAPAIAVAVELIIVAIAEKIVSFILGEACLLTVLFI